MINWQNGITPINETNMNKLVQEDMITDAYSSSSTYAVGDYCIYGNTLYKCTTAISTVEAWNSAHWSAVTVADEIKTSKQNLNNIQIRKSGKTVVVNVFGTFSFTVNSATAEVLGTIPEGYRPSMNISGAPVIGKKSDYSYCPNCYIQIRKNGSIEFYQCSGSQQSIIQIIGTIIYTID